MENIIIILGLLYFIDALLDKFLIWNWIERKGSKVKFKFMYLLSQCRFCIMFHIGWILTLIYGAITVFKIELIVVPFVISGLTRIIEKR